jgi:hypothetical protein
MSKILNDDIRSYIENNLNNAQRRSLRTALKAINDSNVDQDALQFFINGSYRTPANYNLGGGKAGKDFFAGNESFVIANFPKIYNIYEIFEGAYGIASLEPGPAPSDPRVPDYNEWYESISTGLFRGNFLFDKGKIRASDVFTNSLKGVLNEIYISVIALIKEDGTLFDENEEKANYEASTSEQEAANLATEGLYTTSEWQSLLGFLRKTDFNQTGDSQDIQKWIFLNFLGIGDGTPGIVASTSQSKYNALLSPFIASLNTQALDSITDNSGAQALVRALESTGLLELVKHADLIRNFAERRLKNIDSVKGPVSEILEGPGQSATDLVWYFKLGDIFNSIKRNPIAFATINYYMPGLVLFFINVLAIVSDFSNDGRGGSIDDPSNNPEEFLLSLEKAFGNQLPGEKSIFELALRAQNTAQRIKNAISSSSYYRKNIQPQSPNVFGLRLGAANFYVPPLSINVNSFFKTGSLTGGAIRQSSSPKFNSGHKQTSVSLKLFFPNYEEIWGLSIDPISAINLNKDFELDFKTDGSSEQEIDKFLSSLRGLIAAFKYSPILPIRNQYLNSVHGITAVALSSMSISTVPNYPFALMVDLELLNFNHKPFLPMISDFNQSIHWGKYRQYMGKAAGRLHSYINEGFLLKKNDSKNVEGVLEPDYSFMEDESYPRYSDGVMRTNVINEWRNGNNISFYVPSEIQTKVFLPDTSGFRSDQEKIILEVGVPFWERQLKKFGLDLGAKYGRDLQSTIDLGRTRPYSISTRTNGVLKSLVDLLTAGINEPDIVRKVYDYLVKEFIANNLSSIDSDPQVSRQKQDWLKNYDDTSNPYTVEQNFKIGGETKEISLNNVKNVLKNAATSTESTLDELVDSQLIQEGREGDVQRREQIVRQIGDAFMVTLYDRVTTSGIFSQLMEASRYRNQGFFFREWEVPMIRVDLDPQFVTVTGVSVGLGNNFAPLQIQMMDEPTYQHIGGRDTAINITMIIQGETELLKFKKVFDHISSLARLENAVGVIGFLGVKNIITALAGVKYAMPISYSVDTIPNFPHFYLVNLSLLDFDIFQQKREQLNNKQQKDLVEHFSTKKNPFLRIKQLWSATNTYPDFPLDVRSEDGEIIGNLDPDYYFRSFQMFDQDVVNNISDQTSLVEVANLKTRVDNSDSAVQEVQKFVNQLSILNNNARRLAVETGNFSIDSLQASGQELMKSFVNKVSTLGISRSQLRIYFETVLTSSEVGIDKDSLLSWFDEDLRSANVQALGYDIDEIVESLLKDISIASSSGLFDDLMNQIGSGLLTLEDVDEFIINGVESSIIQIIKRFLRLKVIPYGISLDALLNIIGREYFGNPIIVDGLLKQVDGVNQDYFTVALKKQIVELLRNLEKEEYLVSNYSISKSFGSANIGNVESGSQSLYDLINEILTTSTLEGEDEISIDLEDDRFHKVMTYFDAGDEGDEEVSAIMSTAIGDYFGIVKEDGKGRSRFYLTIDGRTVRASSSNGELYLRFKQLFDPQSPAAGTTESLTGVPGATPLNQYQDPYSNNYSGKKNTEVKKHWEKMFIDTSYRDVSGRMLRAFPTYMLWLIDEGGYFAGVKMFDNFYGLQSIIDFSVVSSEDILGDTLIFRVSNLYSKLTTPESKNIFNANIEQFNPDEVTLGEGIESVLDSTLNKARNILSGMKNTYTVDIENIRLKPGVRVHLRAGYGSNPNSLQTIFNGIITQVEAGEIVTVTAQSDGIELGAIVNSTNNKGHSGRIDGGIDTGLWMSEPRDLMVRLLSMGTSRFREGIAWASQGIVFSENKFGIRHFGSILYPPMNSVEKARHEALRENIASSYTQVGQAKGFLGTTGSILGGVAGTANIMNQLWANFGSKRDLEIFKRNIYPGNGTGLAQFLGGDIDDGWASLVSYDDEAVYSDRIEGYLERSTDLMWNRLLSFSQNSLNVGANQTLSDVTGADYVSASFEEVQRRIGGDPDADGDLNSGWNFLGNVVGGAALPVLGAAVAGPVGFAATAGIVGLTGILRNRGSGPTSIFRILGITSANNDDDLPGYDEVSFRAQTYMRTVWDLFKTCARLLPNYIVAVRPFEDRSTVFYGKPHWIYTSGVVPVTTGFPGDRDIDIEGPDEDFLNMMQGLSTSSSQLFDISAALEAQSPLDVIAQRRNELGSSEGIYAPTQYLQGKILNFASEPAINMKGCILPSNKGLVDIGFHLPIHHPELTTSLEDQLKIHKQLDILPLRYRFPFFISTDNSDSPFRTITGSTYIQGRRGREDPIEWSNLVVASVLRNDNLRRASDVWNKLIEFEEALNINISRSSEGGTTSIDSNTGSFSSLGSQILGEFSVDVSGIKVRMPLPQEFSGEIRFDRPGIDAVFRANDLKSYLSDNTEGKFINLTNNYVPYSEWGLPSTPEDEQFYIAMRWPYRPSISNGSGINIDWFKENYFSNEYQTSTVDINSYAFNKTAEDFKQRKVLVYNPSIKRAVVCRPAYFLWNGLGNDSRQGRSGRDAAVVSPDAAIYLGLLNNENGFRTHPTRQECFFGFVPDETPVGVVGSENFVKEFNLNEEKGTSYGGKYGFEDYLIGFGRFNLESPEDLVAEQRGNIRTEDYGNNPLDLYTLSRGLSLASEESFESNRRLGGNPLNISSQDDSNRMSYIQAVLEGEYSLLSNDSLKEILENEIDPSGDRNRNGLEWNPLRGGRTSLLTVYDEFDAVSVEARAFYDENFSQEVSTITGRGRTLLQVQEIWDQFRIGYHNYESVKKIFQQTYNLDPDNEDLMPEYIANIFRSDEFTSSLSIRKYSETANSAIDEFATIFGQDWSRRQAVDELGIITPQVEQIRRNEAIEFVRKNLIDEIPGSSDQGLIDFLNNQIVGSLRNARDTFFVNEDVLNFLEISEVSNVSEKIRTPKQLFLFFVGIFRQKMWEDPYARAWLGLIPDKKKIGNHVDNRWSFRPVDKIFAAFIDPYSNYAKDNIKFKRLLARHAKQGSQSSNFAAAIFESSGEFWSRNVAPIFTGIADALGGLLSTFRLNMLMMGYALNESGKFSQQANILNKALNDSMYYSLGAPGSLLRAVDNPFTREYGEPVVEVREPFQRVHYLSSFSHIISNRIQENINGVATTVTAYSDGKYPVTVALDKALPAERQTEKIVETGIFYDNPIGSGLSGLLHPLFHPLETARGLIKNATGVPDELMAKRVGLAYLKESLQDIYGGELIVIGNADIRPHDMVYLADVYERMYGLFEVEQVVHHFTPEMGYITSITPNALVTINDPSRWYMTSWLHSWFATQNMRNRARIHIQNAIATNSIAANNRYANIDSIFETLEPEMRGSVYYTHGQSALVKDIMSMEAANNSAAVSAAVGSAGVAATTGAAVAVGAGLIPAGIAAAVVGSLTWKAWKWIRNNVLDQHGCYISYLNKNGQPMDAGLSQNQGMAVGMFHSKSLLPGILGTRSQVRTADGYSIIRNDDLLKSLGWSEIQIEDFVRYVSFENAEVHAKVLGLSGLGPDKVSLDRYFRILARVEKVIDGDTVIVKDVLSPSSEPFRVRFSGIDTAESNVYRVEDNARNALGTGINESLILKDSPSGRATLFTANALRNKVFTLRINPTRSGSLSAIAEEDYSPGSIHNVESAYEKDKFSRTLGTFFYKTSNENRLNIISYISNIFRTTLSENGLPSQNPNDYKEKIKLDTYSDSVFYSRFDRIYAEVENASFSVAAASGFLENGFLSEFVQIASGIPSISGGGTVNEDMFKAFVTLINLKLLEATYEKASEWPLVLWDDYYNDGSPVTLNWELVINGLARVYTGDLNTLSPSARLGLEQ